MTLVELMETVPDTIRIEIHPRGTDKLLAEYDGKNSIDEKFNDCEVFQTFPIDEHSIYVTISYSPSLAERLDKVMHDFDPYNYDSEECSVEAAEKAIKESPETVIEELIDMVETLMEEQ